MREKAKKARSSRRPRRRSAITVRRSGWFLMLGLAWIVLGLISMGIPLVARPPADLFFCAILSAAGAGQVIVPLREGYSRATFVEFASATVFLAAGGTLLIIRPEEIVKVALLLAAFLSAEGIIKLTFALQMRGRIDRSWAIFAALLTFALALMAWARWPDASLWVLGLIIGLYLTMGGWSLIVLGWASRRAQRRRTRTA